MDQIWSTLHKFFLSNKVKHQNSKIELFISGKNVDVIACLRLKKSGSKKYVKTEVIICDHKNLYYLHYRIRSLLN